MFYQTIIILFCMLVSSCKTPAYNSLDAQQQSTFKYFKLITAEKTNWLGGRAGVRGTNYNLKIKSSTNSTLNFVELYEDGHLMKVSQKKIDGFICLSASYSENPNPNYGDLPTAGQKNTTTTTIKPWLSYTLGTSKSLQKINIQGFKEIQEDSNIKTYPKKNQ